MRESELKDLAPVIEKRVTLPEDRTKDLRRRVRATQFANDIVLGFYQKFMQDALIDQEEAWDECAQLMGFRSLEHLQEEGYEMSLVGSQLQLRKRKING